VTEPSQPIIRAAGTVTLRGTGRNTEVLVVHRHIRLDWSLPKGKPDKGEYMAATAVRETVEESTIASVLGVPLTPVRYMWGTSPKIVRYWIARPVDAAIAAGDKDFPDDWQPNEEVDEIRWVRIQKLRGLLTYPRDLETVLEAEQLNHRTSPLMLLRHAAAEKRVAFAERHDGQTPHDHLRPLSEEGFAVLPAVGALLAAYGITNFISSPALRCVETVGTRAHNLRIEPAFSEFGADENPNLTEKRIIAVAQEAQPTVVCSHRPVLPQLVRTIARHHRMPEPFAKLNPAEFIVFHRPLKTSGKIREQTQFTVDHGGDTF